MVQSMYEISPSRRLFSPIIWCVLSRIETVELTLIKSCKFANGLHDLASNIWSPNNWSRQVKLKQKFWQIGVFSPILIETEIFGLASSIVLMPNQITSENWNRPLGPATINLDNWMDGWINLSSNFLPIEIFIKLFNRSNLQNYNWYWYSSWIDG